MKKEEQLGLPFPDSWELRGLARLHLSQALSDQDRLFETWPDALAQVPEIIASPDRYWQRVVVARNGKERVCYSPTGALRHLQEHFLGVLKRDIGGVSVIYRHADRRIQTSASRIATAFADGCSIVKNAEAHRVNRSSFCVDLRDAYGQIRAKHIRRFMLRHRRSRSAAWLISRLATRRGRLPQGAITSPYLFNALMAGFDIGLADAIGAKRPITYGCREVNGHTVGCHEITTMSPGLMSLFPFPAPGCANLPQGSVRSGIVYTRYCDDLCFSSPEEEFPKAAKSVIRRFVETHGFGINDRKTREGRNGVLEFPGVVIVRGRFQPKRDYLTKLREEFGKMDPNERQGHLAYLKQFSRSSRRRILRMLRESGNDI